MAFMIHPKHGAINTSDVEAHEKNGWKISTPEEWLALKAKPHTVSDQPEQSQASLPPEQPQIFKHKESFKRRGA